MLLVLCLLVSCMGPGHKEKKFIEGLKSTDVETSTQAFNDFCNWLQTDKSTMDYDFNQMREQLGMKVITSPDGVLKAYSWMTGINGDIPSYANVLQWKTGKNFIAYCGPVDALIAGRKASVKDQSNSPHSLDTIFEIDGGKMPIYLLVQSYTNNDGKCRAYTSAMVINGIKLQLLPAFFDGTEFAGNNEYNNIGNLNGADLFKYDAKTQTFLAYQTDDNDNVIPGKYTQFKLQGDRFTRIDTP